jgi:hypothetical protein
MLHPAENAVVDAADTLIVRADPGSGYLAAVVRAEDGDFWVQGNGTPASAGETKLRAHFGGTGAFEVWIGSTENSALFQEGARLTALPLLDQRRRPIRWVGSVRVNRPRLASTNYSLTQDKGYAMNYGARATLAVLFNATLGVFALGGAAREPPPAGAKRQVITAPRDGELSRDRATIRRAVKLRPAIASTSARRYPRGMNAWILVAPLNAAPAFGFSLP